MAKYDLPNQYTQEYNEFDRLYRLGNQRSQSGNISFTSTSSNIIYNSTTGQEGILQSLQTALLPYLIKAGDFNAKVEQSDYNLHIKDNLLKNDYIGGTTQTPTIIDGQITQVVHKDSGNATLRTDTFTYTPSLITEIRTLSTGETLTLKYYFNSDGSYNRTEVS